MQEKIEKLAAEFVTKLLGIVRTASLDDLRGAPRGKTRGLGALPFAQRQVIARKAAATRKRRAAARKAVKTRQARAA
jgi:hypothetical protein